MNKSILFFTLITLALAALVYACAVNPVTGKKELNLMSVDQEKALGASSDPQIIASFGLYEDERMQKFIDEKGQAMARISHRPELDYQFRILDSDVVNAFAVPGGYVYFTRGIMVHFNNEAEFAGVLGHEIGHITARHSARQYSNQMLAQALFVGGMIASKELRNYADVLSQGLGLLFLKYSRDHESQSDELGVEYSTKIGYNSHKMADFFQTIHRISATSGQSIPTFLSTHPDPLNRYQRVHQLTDKAQARAPGNTFTVNRDPYLRMIDGIVYGPDPRQGFVENNMFYHPELKFQFPVPAGWRHQNSPTAFIMGPENGKAIMQLTLAQEKTLEQAADALLQKYQLTLRDSRKTTLNGMPALVFLADQEPQQQQGQTQQQQEQQQTIRVQSYLVQYNNLIYVQQGISILRDFNAFNNTFNQVGTNFRKLTDPDKLNRQPERVRIKTVQQSGTLQQALNNYNMPSSKHKDLAILNGMELKDRVEKGTLIKTIQQQ